MNKYFSGININWFDSEHKGIQPNSEAVESFFRSLIRRNEIFNKITKISINRIFKNYLAIMIETSSELEDFEITLIDEAISIMVNEKYSEAFLQKYLDKSPKYEDEYTDSDSILLTELED